MKILAGWAVAAVIGGALIIFVLPLLRPSAPSLASAEALSSREFRDCPDCPVMVRIPAASFHMGDAERENERPVHAVTLSAFAVGKFEVTWDQWDACVRAHHCSATRQNKAVYGADHGWGRGTRPVMSVSWDDTKAFVAWLNEKVGGARYRLLTEAEWEYAARAGSGTAFSWGVVIGTGNANCRGCGGEVSKTLPVGSFPPNALGLYDMQGNVWEWVEDCAHDNYIGATNDGSAWTSGDCRFRVQRGGSWMDSPREISSTFRKWNAPSDIGSLSGFRVAKTL